MRHSAFVCPAARINYDLLKWILLGALQSWPRHLDSHMHVFLNKCITQWTHVAQMMHRNSGSTEASTIGGKMQRGERAKGMWLGPVLNVTQCAGTVGHQDLTRVSGYLGFPRHSNWTTLLTLCPAHSCLLSPEQFSPPFPLLPNLSLLQDLASALLAAGLNNLTRRLRMAPQSSCGRLCPLVLAVSLWTLFHYIRFTHTGF